MDEDLKKEMEHVLALENDSDLQKKSLEKILVYLLTLPPPDQSNIGMIKRFITKAYEILPSSPLPQQLAKKLGVTVSRRKAVTFSSTDVRRVPFESYLSPEGSEQLQRESGILPFTNVDTNRKHIPKSKIVAGWNCETKNIAIQSSLLVNSFEWTKEPSVQPQEIKKVDLSIKEILENPHILKNIS